MAYSPRSGPMPPPNTGGFFGDLSGWLPNITWGGGNDPPAAPAFTPPQGSGTQSAWGGQELPPPNYPQMPQVQQAQMPYGPNEAWGSPNTIPPPAPEAVGMEDPFASPAPKKYSFLDNPGASDSLVAFGAAMLKAPDFNTGLGDAALAVNQVARANRPIGQAEYERAKQLAMLKRMESGRGVTKGGASINRDILYRDDKGQTWFDAVGPNNEPGMYNQDTGQFTTGSVPGLTRDVYDFGSNRDKRYANKDADFQYDFAKQVPDLASNVANLDQAIQLAGDPESAVSSSMWARIGGELERLTPGMNLGWNGYDANKVTEYDNRIQQAAISYARMSFAGQGQVTESERAMIAEATSKRGTMTTASAVKMLTVMRNAQQRKIDIYNTWASNAGNIQQNFGGRFTDYVAYRMDLANKEQGASAPAGDTSGNSNPELDDALKQYGG
ncbi:hypothetical protein UFOVP1087_23 [uncultured Caudovirales phage]|uniref:Uncharacterized protein n=1 Tax=uncultured Caudovirales phage TaxID=2100421 RepID=A0A6J5QMP4_9CAUD|nr:hypothetical protein UFOVP910_38 [uncultured Caudovirales phage]CAB4182791.1 hypothetical protein UFOVP1087_23 [uncultured Caudovirales phage]CAB5228214.1 hypothetical protein UFOVP1534_23 [uncultured Caudovirales phage]